MGKRVSFVANGKRVTFTAGKKKKKRTPATHGKHRFANVQRFEVWTIHDEGEREIRRWRGSSEETGTEKAQELAARGALVDLVERKGRRKLLLRTFGN